MNQPITRILSTQQEQNQYFKRAYPNQFQRTLALARDLRKRQDLEYAELEKQKRLLKYDPDKNNPVQVHRLTLD